MYKIIEFIEHKDKMVICFKQQEQNKRLVIIIINLINNKIYKNIKIQQIITINNKTIKDQLI